MTNKEKIKKVYVAMSADILHIGHLNIIKEAVKRKMHVFCEKPVTKSFKQIGLVKSSI